MLLISFKKLITKVTLVCYAVVAVEFGPPSARTKIGALACSLLISFILSGSKTKSK